MTRQIPFLHSLSPAEAADWRDAINARATGFTLCAPEAMPAQERTSARLAVVANPDPAALAEFPALEWVQSLWAGVEKLVTQVPDRVAIVRLTDPQLAETMAEAVLAWTLYLHRDMPRYAAQQARAEWRQHPLPLASERRVAVLGLGALGMRAAERLRANGFDVHGWSRSPKTAPFLTRHGDTGLLDTLAEADIAVSLLPLTTATRGLIGPEALAQMPAGSGIINFGRGPVIDRTALLTALDGPLGHAVLDVFEEEPLPANDSLWQHPKITILPHISAPTHIGSAAEIVAQAVEDFLATGAIPPAVDRARGY